MADRKITAHTAITAAQVADTDVFELVDISDTTDAASGTNKRITALEEKKRVNVQAYSTGVTKNRFIPCAITAAQLTTGPVTINTIRASAFIVTYPLSIDRIACEVTVGTTGKIRLGIWADDGTGYPSTLILDGGEQTISAPGMIGTSTSISATLNPGLYWVGYVTDTGNTMRLGNTASYPPAVGVPSAGASGFVHINWSVAFTYGALPNPFPAGGSATVLNQPIIFIRIV